MSISSAVSNINNRGIYPDLLRHISNQGHDVYVVCPFERRTKRKTNLISRGNVHILGIKTLNITKSNMLEKGLATVFIEYQFEKGINEYFPQINFDLILYTTPPITFTSLIAKLKLKFNAKSYLMLKDIFPQNAVDLGLFRNGSFVYRYFKFKEKQLYEISDYIGCMSPANIDYVLRHNPELNSKKVGLCPNGIEIKQRDKANKSQVFSQYKIPMDKTVFIFGGNLGIGQGVEFIIKGIESNLNQSNAFFVIVGNGNKFDVLSTWFIENKPNNAILLASLERESYDQLEVCCDVGMIFLSDKFSIPNFPSRTLAYMEAKLPILVCTDLICDLGAISEEYDFGKFCEFGKLEEFNEAVNFFIEDKGRILKMGNNSYNFLENNYQVKHVYNSIFENI
ncbi:MAG: glycosyltransferase family 4 protein [Bacteroidia bacterium]|nr:glycosyltransferase family 4 protein [Bacteroidia bacterium]